MEWSGEVSNLSSHVWARKSGLVWRQNWMICPSFSFKPHIMHNAVLLVCASTKLSGKSPEFKKVNESSNKYLYLSNKYLVNTYTRSTWWNYPDLNPKPQVFLVWTLVWSFQDVIMISLSGNNTVCIFIKCCLSWGRFHCLKPVTERDKNMTLSLMDQIFCKSNATQNTEAQKSCLCLCDCEIEVSFKS